MKNYQEVVQYLYRQLPMYQRIGSQAFKKDLTNILRLCQALDHPEDKFPSIHIAGTNGKGSTSHILSALLQKSGLSVGLYTSPHYIDFRERIKINGKEIPEEIVVEFVNLNKEVFETIEPSFFEWSVALAFFYFAREKVDIAIIETGLGGRLDSTNVITPLLSVITNVDLDHMDQLGDNKVLIAREKAGIIKEGVPVLLGEKDTSYYTAVESIANEKNSSLLISPDLCKVKEVKDELLTTEYSILINGKQYRQQSDLGGGYQAYNIQTAMAALIQVSNDHPEFEIDSIKAIEALSNVRKQTNMLGRWQVIDTKPPTILDGAHNFQALKYTMQRFQCIDAEIRHIVLGMSNDKDLDELLNILPRFAVYYFCKADVPRGLAAGELAEEAYKFDLKGEAYPSVKSAFESAIKNASEFDALLVTGSIFIIGEVLSTKNTMS